MSDVLQQRLVLLAQRHPVITVHVGHIEPIAISPPDLVEDLVPLFGRYAVDDQPGCGNRLSRFVAERSRVIKTECRSLTYENFRTVTGHRVTADVIGDRGFLPIFKCEDAQLCRAIALTSVVESWAHEIEQVTRLSRQSAIVVGSHRHARNSIRNPVEIDDQVGGRLGCSLLFGRDRLGLFGRSTLGRFFSLLTYTHFVAFRWEGMLNVFTQRHRIDIRVATRRIVEFDIRDLRRELAITDEVEITTLRVPDRIERIEDALSNTTHFVVGRVPDIHRSGSVWTHRHRESEIVTAWRPNIIANLTAGRIDDLDHLSIRERHDPNLAVLVAESDALSVG